MEHTFKHPTNMNHEFPCKTGSTKFVGMKAGIKKVLKPTKYLQYGPFWKSNFLPVFVRKFPIFYQTWWFFTVFANAHHMSITWWTQRMLSHPVPLWTVLKLPSHLCLCLLSGLLPSGFLNRILLVFLIPSTHCTCPAQLILLNLIM